MKIWYWIFCINLLLLGTYSEAQIIVVKPNGKEPVLKIGGLLQVQADVGDRGIADLPPVMIVFTCAEYD